jgi:DNA-binding NtrC family response regulator
MSAQVMLLRALAEGEFQPLGADYRRQVNVRVVAATNRPLDSLTVGSEFRNDLFFRLRYFLLSIPPLRERGDDWRLLLDHFMERLRRQYGVRRSFSPAALSILDGYDWPGNVRELFSVATMGYAMCETDLIEPQDFVSLLFDRRGEDLYRRMVASGESFWDVLHRPFLDRDLNRRQMKVFIRKGLVAAGGSYRKLLSLFNLGEEDYQKFMDFLRHHRLKP